MKKYIFVAVLLFILEATFAQTKPKQKSLEKPPTQKEMGDMMKEMQQALEEMSPEDKKAMEDMGVKMPDMKNIQKNLSGVTDAQLKKAYEDENRIVPQKDAARISTALAVTLSNGEMNAFINKTHLAVLEKLSANTKTKSTEIMQQVIKQKSSIANTAIGLWIDGKPTLALYLMGEACKAEPANAIHLNNYASFLTMCGAEQLALPILNNLDKRYPNNSSIINNISQAWLGLGDLQRAEEFADKAIRIYAYHPQANMAKCLIEESKGNIPAAIAAAKKSINQSYSNEKENKLGKLGYDLKSDDLNWDRPMPQDALGLGKFSWPEYPLDVEQNKMLEKEWNDFKKECQQKINELKIKQERAEQEYLTQSGLRTQQILQAGQNGHYVQPMPGYAAKAIKKLGHGVNDDNGNVSFVFAKELEPVVKALTAVGEYEKILNEKQIQLDRKYEDQIGEGKTNPLEAICKDENAIRSEFLKDANSGLQSAYRNYFNYSRRRTSDLLYYYQYTMWPDQFELAKLMAQVAWLTQIKDQRVFFKDKSSWCTSEPTKEKSGPLQNFDDVHCDYVSTLNLGVYKITSSCSNLVGEFDFGGVNINYSKNIETGRYSGSAMVGASKGFDGPAGSEVEASIAALVEWDNSGITDVGAIVGVDVNANGVTVVGAESRITVNTGVSTSGKGILQGM
ncbi:MAG: tetratricopeptide repeat protein [Lutibacter sp.]